MAWLTKRRARGASSYPAEVTHALDYLAWAALDDMNLLPTEPRPFGEDEWRYNRILNRHFDIDIDPGFEPPMTEPHVPSEFEEEGMYIPRYFPDPPEEFLATVAKDAFLINHLTRRVNHLRDVAKLGSPLGTASATTHAFLVSPDRYAGFYEALRERGTLFADASPYDRERASVAAMRAAIVLWGNSVDGEDWYVVNADLVKAALPEFVEPEALLPR